MEVTRHLAHAIGDRTVSTPGLAAATEYLVGVARGLEELAARPGSLYQVEVSVSAHSGGFPLEFFHHRITNAYRGLANVAVRVRPRRGAPAGRGAPAVQLMAHFDSTVGSVGASDCAACVGVAVEATRAVLAASDPAAALPADLVLVLNGGEETLLQAAHGYYSQHPVSRAGAAARPGTSSRGRPGPARARGAAGGVARRPSPPRARDPRPPPPLPPPPPRAPHPAPRSGWPTSGR